MLNKDKENKVLSLPLTAFLINFYNRKFENSWNHMLLI